MANQATIRTTVTLPLHSVQVAKQRAALSGQSFSTYLSLALNNFINEDEAVVDNKQLSRDEVYANAAKMSDEEAYKYLSRMRPKESKVLLTDEEQADFEKRLGLIRR
jgi:hypothetical protein